MNIKLFQKGTEKWSLVLEHELVRGLNTTQIKEFIDICSRELNKTEQYVRGELNDTTTKERVSICDASSNGRSNSALDSTSNMASQPPTTINVSNNPTEFLSKCGLEFCDKCHERIKHHYQN